jgi:hypothetical protein
MDWYRKAKIINKDSRENWQTFNRCMICGRFATSPSGEDGGDIVWKSEDQMDEDEKMDRDMAIYYWKNGGPRASMGISDGYCPKCLEEALTQVRNRHKSKEFEMI